MTSLITRQFLAEIGFNGAAGYVAATFIGLNPVVGARVSAIATLVNQVVSLIFPRYSVTAMACLSLAKVGVAVLANQYYKVAIEKAFFAVMALNLVANTLASHFFKEYSRPPLI